MQASLVVNVALAQPVINQVHILAELVLAHAEIVRLDIPVQVLTVVEELEQSAYLNAKCQSGPH